MAIGILLINSVHVTVSSPPLSYNTDTQYCEIGKQYFDTEKNKCKSCPRCPKSPDFRTYQLNISDTHGALECYPCYCKPEKKAYNSETGRCERCPECKYNGLLNTSVPIVMDKYNGGLNCYECNCNPGYFMNYRTHHQCVECKNCSANNRVYDKQCSQNDDATCGKCLDGYREPKYSVFPCVLNTTEELETTITTSTTRKNMLETNQGHGPNSHLIMVVVLIMTCLTAVGIGFVVYRIIKKPCCHDIAGLISASTSATTVSAKSLDKQKRDSQCGYVGPVPSTPSMGDLGLDGPREYNKIEEENETRIMPSPNNSTIYVFKQIGDNNSVFFNASHGELPS